MDCYIEVGDDQNIYNDLLVLPQECYAIIKSKKADASIISLEVIISLSSITIPLIARVIIERIRAKKYTKVKINGLELEGLSEKSIERILRERKDKHELNS